MTIIAAHQQQNSQDNYSGDLTFSYKHRFVLKMLLFFYYFS